MSTSASAAGQPARKPNRGLASQPGQRPDRIGGGGTESREEIVGREKAQFGGVKIGSAFFGWLAAAGTSVLLSAIATAFGAALLANNVDIAGAATANPEGASAVIAALVALGGAILGGLAGMRFHRRVDKAGLGS